LPPGLMLAGLTLVRPLPRPLLHAVAGKRWHCS
jgi:hypothetical protein